MPAEKSYVINEPSVGPIPSQTLVKASTLTRAEQADGTETKIIATDVFTMQLVATSVSTSIFCCDDNYQVVAAKVVAETIGGASAAVQVERLTGVTAPGSGIAQLTATMDVSSAATAHAVTSGAVIANPDTFAPGDRLGIKLSGTLTGLVGQVTVVLKRV